MKKWKKLLAGLLAMALLCTSDYGLTAKAQEESLPQFLYSVNEGGTVTVVKYQWNETEVEIPCVAPDGKKVTRIGGEAFSGCSSLTKISIPESVTAIEGKAFSGCSSLTEITIPDSVTAIGGEAFSGCSSLAEITIPSGVTEIWSWTFQACTGLVRVTIPPSVTEIHGDPFYGCRKTDIKIYGRAGSAAEIWAEQNGWSFVESEDPAYDYQVSADGTIMKYTGSGGEVTIPSEIGGKEVTGIGPGAFSGHTEMSSVTLPQSVKNIGNEAFLGCSGLTQISIPAGVESIGDGVFSDCSGLTKITVEEDNARYDSRKNCNAVIDKKSRALIVGCRSTVIPSDVTSIRSKAFSGCSGLVQVSISKRVTSIGEGAFSGCSGLAKIKVEKGNARYDSRKNCNAIIDKKSNALVAGCKNTVIPSDVTGIGNYAFSGCSGLTRIKIPVSVTSIGSAAFSGCSGLTSITIPGRVAAIGGEAFSGCSGLTNITIPESVTVIGGAAFLGCSGLTEITIPNSVTHIWGWTFRDCENLISVTIPAGVTEIEKEVFYNCNKNLTIYGAAGSAAEACAKENQLNFEVKNDIGWAEVTLSQTGYVYDGKPKTPSVTVKLAGNVLIPDIDYTVSYSNNIKEGTASATVTGKGSYTGSRTVSFTIRKKKPSVFAITCKKTLYKVTYGAKPFKINAASKKKMTFTSSKPGIAAVDRKTGKVTIKNTGIAVITVRTKKASAKVTIRVSPVQPSVNSLKALTGKKLKVSWMKDGRASGYQVQISTDRKFKKAVESKNITKTSYTFTKLKAGKKYYVRVRSYKKSGKETLYGAWSKKQSRKI